jgi:glycoprotein 6-alpha-L-fucosyltransferase
MTMKGTWRVVVGLLLFWLLILVYMSTTLYQSSDVNERTERQLAKALQELDALKKQNEQLQKLANELKDIRVAAGKGEGKENQILRMRLEEANKKLQRVLEERQRVTSHDIVPGGQSEPAQTHSTSSNEPDLAHEKLRRKIENGVQEYWFYVRSELSKVKETVKENTGVVAKMNNIIEDGRDQTHVLLTDLYNLSMSNGHDMWRKKESQDLSNLIQNRIHHLQHPKDCSKARKLVCNLNKGCGYGCQIHHLVYCFIIAYGTERTLILDSRGWRYSSAGWEKVFKPLSETCVDRDGRSSRAWGPYDVIKDVQVVDLPIVDSLHPRPPYMPLAIPKDIAPRLMRLHGSPIVWWIGQFLKYTLRPQEQLAQDIDQVKRKLGYKNPIVGVHVRRTDKVGTEAAFHGIEEYMTHVKEYYDLLERRQKVDKRRIYLATDDPNLLTEARNKYPDYDILGESEFSRSAGLGTRYSDASLRGIILDIHLLSISDHLVCTFSSQVCRLAYEMMQSLHPDASNRFHSLDDIYYYGGQNAHNQNAIYPHHPRTKDEIVLSPGDYVGIAGNHWDGYSKGLNRRLGQTGLYPSYKVEEKIDIVDFPTYPEADKKLNTR